MLSPTDAQKPHCSPCLKAHAAILAASSGGRHPPPTSNLPECTWDPDRDHVQSGSGGEGSKRRTGAVSGGSKGTETAIVGTLSQNSSLEGKAKAEEEGIAPLGE